VTTRKKREKNIKMVLTETQSCAEVDNIEFIEDRIQRWNFILVAMN
jgi:hypothetical protein